MSSVCAREWKEAIRAKFSRLRYVADEPGLTFYPAEIDRGRLSISDIAHGMTSSAEFACFTAADARDLGDQSSARRVDIALLNRHRADPTDLFAENDCFTN